jgi:hypothetical protein
MRQVRTTIEIRQGVEVELLFTPRLYSFKGKEGIDFSADKTDAGEVFALYADIIYCAALNLWTLQGNAEDKFPHHRADFHEFSMADPKAFGKVVNFALEALTGKGLKDFAAEAEKVSETGEKPQNTREEVKKKKHSLWTMLRLKRS